MSSQCSNVGEEFCLVVKYEDLCLHPEKTLKRVVSFLIEEWSDKLLNHQNFIGSDIVVSKTEWSSHQIVYKNIISNYNSPFIRLNISK